MSEISFDGENGVFVITMVYQGKKTICVHLAPGRNDWFETVEVKYLSGAKIRGDQFHVYGFHAKAELKVWFRWRLRPRGSHKIVCDIGERVEIAFIHHLHTLDDGELKRLSPVGKDDLAVIKILAKRISAEVKNMHLQAKQEQRRLASGYLHSLKADIITDWRKSTPCSNELRDFYSSVLGTAFAWKKNRVPYEIYDIVQKVRPGLMLAFALQ